MGRVFTCMYFTFGSSVLKISRLFAEKVKPVWKTYTPVYLTLYEDHQFRSET